MAVNTSLALLITAKDSAQGPLRKLGRNITALKKNVETTGRSFKTLGALVGIGAGGLGAAAVTAGYAFNSFQEQSQLAFTTILKDGAKAQKMIAGIQDVAKVTPFDTESLTRATQRLLAFGFSADDVLPTLIDISDTVSGLGGSAEMIDRITNAFGQMTAKGKAQTEELMQLAEAGIPVWKILADNVGELSPRLADAAKAGKITQAQLVEQIQKMATAGKIPAAKAIAMLRKGMAQQFGGLSKMQSTTAGGAASTFKDTLMQLLGDLTKGPFKETAGALLTMADALDRLRDNFKDLPAPIQTVVSWIATLLSVIVGGGIIGGILSLVGVLGGGAGLLGVLGTVASFIGTVVVAALGALLSPVGLVVLAVAGLALAWATNFLGVRDATTAAVKWIGDRFGDLVKAADALGRDVAAAWSGLVDAVGRIVSDGWGYVVSLFEWVGSAALTVLQVAIGLWVLAFRGLVAAVGPIVSAGWEYVVSLFQWLSDAAGAILAAGWSYAVSLFDWLNEQTGGRIADGLAYVASIFQWLVDTVGATLAAGWEYVVTLFGWLRSQLLPSTTATVNGVAGLFDWLREAGANAVGWMVDRVSYLFGWLSGAVLGPLATAWTAVVRIFEWVRDVGAGAIQWMVDRIVGLFTWLGDRVRSIWQPIADLIGAAQRAGAGVIGGGVTAVPTGGGMTGFVNGVPRYAMGGVVPGALGAPSLAMVHGGETITPAGWAGGTTVVVNLNAPVYGFANFEDAVVSAVDRASRRGRI